MTPHNLKNILPIPPSTITLRKVVSAIGIAWEAIPRSSFLTVPLKTCLHGIHNLRSYTKKLRKNILKEKTSISTNIMDLGELGTDPNLTQKDLGTNEMPQKDLGRKGTSQLKADVNPSSTPSITPRALSLKVLDWDTEILQFKNYLKQTELLDQGTKDNLCLAIDEIFCLYNQFEEVNLAASNYYIPLTVLKCGCNLKKTKLFGLVIGDAALPLKLKLVYPNLVAYVSYVAHFCREQRKYVFILLKSQSRISPLKTAPTLEMEILKIGVGGGTMDLFQMLEIPPRRTIFCGDSMVVSALTQKNFRSPELIEYKFLQRLRDIKNLGFPLTNYLQVDREQITIVDILTKAKLCTIENLPKFIGKWCPEKQTFDQKCPFWEGPSQKNFCELVWRLGGQETKCQLDSSFSTHKLLNPQITQND